MAKDVVAALDSSIQSIRGRRGPDNDPFLFVRVVDSMYTAAREIERLRKENEEMDRLLDDCLPNYEGVS